MPIECKRTLSAPPWNLTYKSFKSVLPKGTFNTSAAEISDHIWKKVSGLATDTAFSACQPPLPVHTPALRVSSALIHQVHPAWHMEIWGSCFFPKGSFSTCSQGTACMHTCYLDFSPLERWNLWFPQSAAFTWTQLQQQPGSRVTEIKFRDRTDSSEGGNLKAGYKKKK